MTFPEEQWIYTKKTEAVRVLQTAYSIKNHFYLKSGFFVLPRMIPNDSKTIFFPALKYPYNFWDIVKQNSVELTKENNPIIEELQTLITPQVAYENLKTAWNKINTDFWNRGSQMMPHLFKDVVYVSISVFKRRELCFLLYPIVS